ncbi:hypothetical protein [Paenibacillus hunanensis]|uniref:CxxH/CxxC protein n=1 Tax=Paenibacillus hunanensis TaxID=539262 RepID=A0ABU1J541_9BACL|nr:hypothetical protein [Paenibacillus hunanensis]MDR6246346.1 hypothetical protein [Paenibacillus hunanensis]WPP42133.1 hypothetical protein SK066_04025 [Paenibacillus hunanensis]GGJ30428.1 hypothetical protein GCM10008022_44040 [Paenibacillus hunanensis]
MPKLLCTCNNILNLQDIPCKVQYNFISDVDYDKYHDNINAEELYQEMKIFVECDKCGRLWFFWNGFDEEPLEYLPVSKQI